MPVPQRRFLYALVASLLLHGLALSGATALQTTTPPVATPAALTATLLRPAQVTPDEGPLLKNTLTEGSAQRPPPPSLVRSRSPAPSAARKLNEHVYYPPEAIAQGWEGEVRLLLTLDASGRVADVRVASSSGHAILDQAAVRAAYAVGQPLGDGRREIIWPVTFRLQR